MLAALATMTSLVRADTPPLAGLDNAALIPRILPDQEVKLEGASPDWVKSLIMVQFRIETVTPGGTFASAVPVLDFYARLGVNGLWINPVQERGSRSNGYNNFGPHTLEPLLADAAADRAASGSGEDKGSREAAWVEARKFVEEAHRRNIRIFFDIIVWGTAKKAPLVREHPEFYAREKDGMMREVWGGFAFNWEHPGFRQWFEEVAVAFLEKTGADGFRVDLAPDVSGYFFEQVRKRLAAAGRKIVLIAEMPHARPDVFDFSQTGVTGWTEEPDWAHPEHLAEQRQRFGRPHEYFLRCNPVEAIRSGRGIGSATLQQRGQGGHFRYYTANLLCHDDAGPAARGNRVTFAYGTLFTPFLPMWWAGEEWDNPRQPLPDPAGTGVMYFNTIDWQAAIRKPNAAFLEDIKAFIRIRRSFPDIFEHFPARTTGAAIAKADTRLNGRPNPLQAYARFHGGRAILVVPNSTPETAVAAITPDPAAWGLPSTAAPDTLRVTSLLDGRPVPLTGAGFQVSIPAEHLGLLLVEPAASPPPPTPEVTPAVQSR